MAEPNGLFVCQFTAEKSAVALPKQAKRTTAFAEGKHATVHPSWRQHFEEIEEDFLRHLVFATRLEPRWDRIAVDRDGGSSGERAEKLRELSLLAAFDGTGYHWTPAFRLEVTPENHKQKPVHATGFRLEHDAPARSPMANGSTRSKGSELPWKEHCREEHPENATFRRKRQRNVGRTPLGNGRPRTGWQAAEQPNGGWQAAWRCS